MSAKLVRKLLQETAEPAASSDNAEADHDTKNQQRKRKRQQEATEAKPVDEQAVVDLEIKTLLALDKKPAKRKASTRFLDRKQKENQQESKRHRMLTETMVGNSRSSSTQKSNTLGRYQPTITKQLKRKLAKERTEQSLQNIAKLLKKSMKKQKK